MYEPTPECQAGVKVGQTVDSLETLLSMPLVASPRLRWFITAILLAFAALPAITLLPHLFTQPAWLLALSCFWILVGFGWWELQTWLKGFPCWLSLRGDEWCLEFSSQGVRSVCPAQRVGESLVWSWLLVVPLRFSDSGERYTLVCLPDSAERDELRRLRVALTSLC